MSGVAPGPAVILVFSGRGGVGKGTLQEKVASELGAVGIQTHRFVSATTRAIRVHAGEKPGQHYHYLSHEEFRVREMRGEFVESVRKPDGTRYGLLKKEVALAPRESVSLVDTDLDGGLRISALYPQTFAFWVVATPDLDRNRSLCRYRMVCRGDSMAEVDARSGRDDEEALRIKHLLAHRRYRQLVNREGGLSLAAREVCNLVVASLALSAVDV